MKIMIISYIYSTVLWVIQIDFEPAGREIYSDNENGGAINDFWHEFITTNNQ